MFKINKTQQGGRAAGSAAPRVRGALVSLSLSMLLSTLGTSSANVALPALAQAFGASFQQVQWIVLAYLLAITSLIVSVGRLGDIVGRRRLLLAGLLLFSAGSVLCGAAPVLWLLIAGRAVQGIGAAVMMAITMAFVGEIVPKERTGSAMGLLGTMSAAGTALGPSLGGFLLAGFGWQAIFFINVPLGLLTCLLAQHYLPVDRRGAMTSWREMDLKGSAWLTLTLAAYALAVTMGRGSFGYLNAVLLVAAGCGLGLFIHAEFHASSPMIRLAMFREPVLSASLAMSALVSTVMMATLVVGPFYLSRALGLGASLVGLVMSAGPVVAALTGLPAGRWVDRLGTRKTTLIGLFAMVAGAFILAIWSPSPGVAGYVVPLMIITGGYALFQTANNTAVMKDVHGDQRGGVSGLLNLSRNLGLITGSSVMGAVFAAAAGSSDLKAASSASVAFGMRATLAVAALLIVVALVIAVTAQALLKRQPASGPLRTVENPQST